MNEITPKKKSQHSPLSGFSPVILPESPATSSPQRNLTGLPRVIRDLVADIFNAIQRWNTSHINGASLVKEIASLKSDNVDDFSKPLESKLSGLFDVVETLKGHKKALEMYCNQMTSTAKLQKLQEPVFISMDLKAISKLVVEIFGAYEAELETKTFVLENIAHVRNKDQAMFMAALWTYQYKIPESISLKLEALLIETGHRKIT